MSQLDDLCRNLSVADLTLMVMIEDLTGVGQKATATKLAGAINGAPASAVKKVLDQLVLKGALDNTVGEYEVTPLGAVALEREVDDWAPAPSQEARREAELAMAARVRT